MNLLAMFARYWKGRAVKTRLAADIGSRAARDLYYQFLLTLLERFQQTADLRTIVFTPPHRESEFSDLVGLAWQIVAQQPGHLGQRLRAFFDSAFQTEDTRVVVIGSDSPTLPKHALARAFELLQRYPVVLGPAEDGGYYLVGAAQRTPPIFKQVPWGTADVLARTRALLHEAGLDWAELPTWHDVDRLSDLRRLHQELTDGPERRRLYYRELRTRVAQLISQHSAHV